MTIDGTPVTLSATEYKLLLELATNAVRVLIHDQILRQVWGLEYSGESDSFARSSATSDVSLGTTRATPAISSPSRGSATAWPGRTRSCHPGYSHRLHGAPLTSLRTARGHGSRGRRSR